MLVSAAGSMCDANGEETAGYLALDTVEIRGRVSTTNTLSLAIFDALLYYSTSQVYLKSASNFLRDSPGGLCAADITGLWVASDDPTVLQDMQSLAPRYFPNVGFESIIWVSGRTAIRPKLSREPLATHSVDMVRNIVPACYRYV